MTTLGDIGGEFALIDRIAVAVGTTGKSGARVGIGDDCAVLALGGDGDLLVTTDLLIEDVHFRMRYGDAYSLGMKAAAVNLSDIAAMGGVPTAAFISLALPKSIDAAFVDELYRGMNEMFGMYDMGIDGGDTNVSPGPLTVNVTLLGTVPSGLAALRSTARPGDVILVTATLGAAAAGFTLLEKLGRAGAEAVAPEAVRAQLRPFPRCSEGRLLRAAGQVTAMMDLSDGLIGDLGKLCKASGVGARLERDAAPVADAVLAAVRCLQPDAGDSRLAEQARDMALRGGEDYELLFTARPEDVEALIGALERRTGTKATVVGRITDEAGVVTVVNADGKAVVASGGWDHFAA